MSRIGRQVIIVPEGVTFTYADNTVTVKGPKGTLTQKINSNSFEFEQSGNELTVKRNSETKDVKSKHGLYRALVANMVKGVKDGFTKTLIVNGVGYKTSMNGKKLVMNLGLSHTVEIETPEGLEITCVTPTEIRVSGTDKDAVGQLAAVIKSKRPIEPYHGYGIRYSSEVVTLKEGKTAGK